MTRLQFFALDLLIIGVPVLLLIIPFVRFNLRHRRHKKWLQRKPDESHFDWSERLARGFEYAEKRAP